MFNVRPVWALFTCALALNATPGFTIQSDLSSTIDDGGYVVANAALAQSFTPSANYTLTTVIVDLTNAPYNFEPSAKPRKMRGATRAQTAPVKKGGAVTPYTIATLYADNSGSPGASLAISPTQVADTSLTGTPQQFTFTFNYQVVSGTRYWIGLSSPNGSTAFWSGSDFASGTDIDAEFYEYGNVINSVDEFGSAFLIGVFGSAPISTTPAPATVWLTLLGLGCAAFYVRRKKLA